MLMTLSLLDRLLCCDRTSPIHGASAHPWSIAYVFMHQELIFAM